MSILRWGIDEVNRLKAENDELRESAKYLIPYALGLYRYAYWPVNKASAERFLRAMGELE